MIAIIKYNAGNIKSVQNAIDRLGKRSIITDDPKLIISAKKVIFPGVGHAASAMEYLKEKKLDLLIPTLKQPFLGICLGMQLMCDFLEEGNTNGLNLFKIPIKKFPPQELVPHMGWNTIYNLKGDLFKDIPENTDFYFVHSYYAGICENTSAICNYIAPFSVALQKDNFYAVQFHPEKSAKAGEKFFENFLNL